MNPYPVLAIFIALVKSLYWATAHTAFSYPQNMVVVQENFLALLEEGSPGVWAHAKSR